MSPKLRIGLQRLKMRCQTYLRKTNRTCGRCNVCNSKAEEYVIMCADCKEYVHFACSELPVYQLWLYTNTTRKYTCEKCTFTQPCYEKENKKQWISNAILAIQCQKTSLPVSRQQKTSAPPTSQSSSTTSSSSSLSMNLTTVSANITPVITALPTDSRSRAQKVLDAISPTCQAQTPLISNSYNTSTVTETLPTNITQPGNAAHSSQTQHVIQQLVHAPEDENRPEGGSPPTSDGNTRGTGNVQSQGEPLCENHIRRRCGDRACTLRHLKLCWAFLWDGHGPEGCQKSDAECEYKHPDICPSSWHRRYCPNLRTCQYRHLNRTTENPRNTRRQQNRNQPRTATSRSDGNQNVQPQNRQNNFSNRNRQEQSNQQPVLNRTSHTHSQYRPLGRSEAQPLPPDPPQTFSEAVRRSEHQTSNPFKRVRHANEEQNSHSTPAFQENDPGSTPNAPHLNPAQTENSHFLSMHQFQNYWEQNRLELTELKKTLLQIQESLNRSQHASAPISYQISPPQPQYQPQSWNPGTSEVNLRGISQIRQEPLPQVFWGVQGQTQTEMLVDHNMITQRQYPVGIRPAVAVQ